MAGLILVLITILGLCRVDALAQNAIMVNEQSCIVSASSVCDEYEDMNFASARAFNMNPDEPWMAAGEFNPKKGEWLKLTFTQPVSLMALRITPGFGRTGKYYHEYSRLKRFEVILDKAGKIETRTYTRHFDSDPEKDMVLLFAGEPVVKSFKIKILEVYPGKKGSNALIGNVEPVILSKGRVVCSSWAVEEAISFLKAAGSPELAFSFVPRDESIKIDRLFRHSNPLDKAARLEKRNRYDREKLRKDWGTWEMLCRQIASDYAFNSFEAVSYIWKDPATKLTIFDFTPSDFGDVLNSYTFAMTRQKVTEKISRKDPKTGKTTEESITILKAVVTEIKMVSDVYAP
jgi:hypothetical protein